MGPNGSSYSAGVEFLPSPGLVFTGHGCCTGSVACAGVDIIPHSGLIWGGLVGLWVVLWTTCTGFGGRAGASVLQLFKDF